MKVSNHDPRRIVRRLLVYGALISVVVIVLLHFLLFSPYKEALKLLLPSALASLIIVLLVYAFRHTLLEEADKFLTQRDVDYVATQIVNELRSKTSPAKGLAFFERWNEVPWQDVIGEAKEIEFLASYMDTWIIQTAELLQQTFARGGIIRAVLPKPDSKAGSRVLERFPEYNPELVYHKINNTIQKLQKILDRSGNKRAKLEVYWTTTFCMHCLLWIDKKRLIISPFDHFRRGHIEGPAFLIDLDGYPRLAEWVRKEFDGFRTSGELWRPGYSKAPAAGIVPVPPEERLDSIDQFEICRSRRTQPKRQPSRRSDLLETKKARGQGETQGCPECEGSGTDRGGKPCQRCSGMGKIYPAAG